MDEVRDDLLANHDQLDAESVWREICERASLPPTASFLSEREFDALVDQIAVHDPLCNLLARSVRIRRTAARRLAELGR